MHNLRRVEAGLKGEYLAAVQDDLAATSSGVTPPEPITERSPIKKRKTRDDRALPLRQSQPTDENDLLETDPIEGTSQQELAGKDLSVSGWQNKDDYEHEQTIEQGEIGPRDNSNAALNHNRAGSNQPPMIENTEVSKEERKRQKKERKKVEQREKEEKRKRTAEEDRKRDFGGEVEDEREDEIVAARMTMDGRKEEIKDSVKGDRSVQDVAGKEEKVKKMKKRRKSDD